MTDTVRLSAARGFFAIANGPLAFAVLLNGNALVFHDVERSRATGVEPALRKRCRGGALLDVSFAARDAAHTHTH